LIAGLQSPQFDACLAIVLFALLCWEVRGGGGSVIANSQRSDGQLTHCPDIESARAAGSAIQ